MIKRFFSRTTLLLGGGTLAAVVLLAAGAWATGARVGAASGVSAVAAVPDSSTAAALCQAFVDRFAQDLGKTPDELKAAAQKAAADVTADAVRNGKLTADQAARLRQRLGSGSVCQKLGARGQAPVKLVVGRQYLKAAALVLSLQPADLRTALKNGKTLHQLADEKHLTEAQFRDAVVKDLTAQLDTGVKAGKVTTQQADKILARFKSGPLPGWDTPIKGKAPAV